MIRGAFLLAALLALAGTAAGVDRELERLARDPDSFRRSEAARRLGKDGSARAAALLAELLADRDPYVRDHAVIACGKLERADAVTALAPAAKSREELTRRNAAEALGRTRSPAALPLLRKLVLNDPEPSVRVRALDWMWGYRGNAEALALAVAAGGHKDPRVRAAAVETAGRLRGLAAEGLVQVRLADPDEGVRCVARMELRHLAPDRALAGLADAAKAEGWRTRAQAVDDASHLKEAPAVDALVALVGDGVLRVSTAAHRALVSLTGKEIGRDAELWRAWWKEARAGWKAPSGKSAPAGDDGGRTVALFQGIEAESEALALVIDVSGSMAKEMPDDPKGRTRWDYVREELSARIDRIADGRLLNLVVFGEEPRAAFPKPAKLSARTRKQLASFAKRVGPGDRGNLLAAVLHALEQPGVDTVYLLSDGAPSAGDMVDKGRVRSAIRSRNRMLKRTIHAIGFGSTKETERRFLEGLAHDSGGLAVFR